MRKLKFILSGGGTGGHIYPAVAIAEELKRRYPEAGFLFVGARDRMEMQKVPQAGFEIKGLWISGIQRKLTLKNMLFPLKLLWSVLKSRKIIRKYKPDAVIGTGGFASGPLLKAAIQMRIPTLIQEQNAYAGVTNKWLASGVSSVCVAYEGMEKYFPENKLVLTGNPVRSNLLKIASKNKDALQQFGLDPDKKTVLVLGGSQGARTINETIAENISFFNQLGVQLVWQCGKLYYNQFKKFADTIDVQLFEFIQNMDDAYAVADIIISRSGALSVSELCLVGKPVIFIPSPNVAEDHQTKNAAALAEKQAAVMIREKELNSRFQKEVQQLLGSEEYQDRLSENIRQLARPLATVQIVDQIEKLIKKQS